MMPPQSFDLEDREQDRRPIENKCSGRQGCRTTGGMVAIAADRGTTPCASRKLSRRQWRGVLDLAAAMTGFEIT